MGDDKMWIWAFIPCGIACLAAAALSMTLKPVRPSEPALVAEAEGELDGGHVKPKL
jgi:hypothetical protein